MVGINAEFFVKTIILLAFYLFIIDFNYLFTNFYLLLGYANSFISYDYVRQLRQTSYHSPNINKLNG